MTTTLTPTTIGDQIVALPPDLANSIAQARTRFDAAKKAKEEEEDPEEEADESDDEEAAEDEEEAPSKGSKISFFDKMKAAKAAKSSKKDSDDIEAIFDRIDSLEAENEVLASLVSQDIHEDAEDHEDAGMATMTDEEMQDMTPQEIALQLIAEFEEAKPFLPAEASVGDYSDIYDIYEDAIATRYPNALINPDAVQEDDDDRIDPMDADELRGAFKMMVIGANPMRMAPGMSMDSADESDRSFANALGLRSDSCDESTMPKTPKRTEYY